MQLMSKRMQRQSAYHAARSECIRIINFIIIINYNFKHWLNGTFDKWKLKEFRFNSANEIILNEITFWICFHSKGKWCNIAIYLLVDLSYRNISEAVLVLSGNLKIGFLVLKLWKVILVWIEWVEWKAII